MKRKVIAGVLIVVGLAVMSVPLYFRLMGNQRNEQMLQEFQNIVEQEKAYEEEKEDYGQEETETAISKEDATTLSKEAVIGLIEIDALDLKYAVLEGTDSHALSWGIGHIANTAEIGEQGNCVLAGHNGSRHGTFFTNLKNLKTGDIVKLTDKKGKQYLYEVESITIVDPFDNSVKNQGEERELTLLTCENKGTMRLIVKCSLQEVVE